MKTINLNCSFNRKDFQALIHKYHFEDRDFASLEALERALRPLLRAKAYYVFKKQDEVVAYEDYAAVFLTLGDGVDALQELYLRRECVSEAYMLECLASELLMKAYEECVEYLQKESGKWAVKIDFLGDSYPLELMQELYKEFPEIEITYNEQFVLSPKKSVVFLLPVSTEKTQKNPSHICADCKNKVCMYRTETVNTYGYQRIFGGKKPCRTD